MSLSRALYIDDRDPAIIYSPPNENGRVWRPFTGEPTEYMRTTTHANQTGAIASITFTGSDITVFGTVSSVDTESPDPFTHYILDSFPPAPFRPIPINETQYNITFYQSPKNLGSGIHSLQIVLQSVGNYWLDYMVINGNTTLSAGNNVTTRATTGAEAIHTVTSELSHTLFTSTTTSPTPLSSAPASREVIASSVLGGILGLVSLIGLMVLVHRWRCGKRSQDPESTLTPFNPWMRSASNINSPGGISPVSTFQLRNKKHRQTIVLSRLNLGPPPVYHSPRF
ncbi:hypothetical protein AN958_02110 [Leucoagaricus sp. SymC.cos]|nr:hypothetical protein AN958_02110 [Leucoagaricus sp. SymC.cos]